MNKVVVWKNNMSSAQHLLLDTFVTLNKIENDCHYLVKQDSEEDHQSHQTGF